MRGARPVGGVARGAVARDRRLRSSRSLYRTH
jgi:hypothetical protein